MSASTGLATFLQPELVFRCSSTATVSCSGHSWPEKRDPLPALRRAVGQLQRDRRVDHHVHGRAVDLAGVRPVARARGRLHGERPVARRVRRRAARVAEGAKRIHVLLDAHGATGDVRAAELAGQLHAGAELHVRVVGGDGEGARGGLGGFAGARDCDHGEPDEGRGCDDCPLHASSNAGGALGFASYGCCGRGPSWQRRGPYTLPSRTTYPHQWNWDSALAALGWAELDPARAWTELESLAGARDRRRDDPAHRLPVRPPAVAHRGALPARAALVGEADRRRRPPHLRHHPASARGHLHAASVRGPSGRAPRTRARSSRSTAGTASCSTPATRTVRRAGADPPVGVGPRQRGRVGRPAVARPARGGGRAPARHRLGGRRRAARPRALPPLPHAGPPGHRRGLGPARARRAPARFRVLDAGFSAILARACLDLADWRSGWASRAIAEESRSAGERVAAALRARAASDGLIRAVDAVDGSPLPVTSAGSALALLAPGLADRQIAAGRDLVLDGALASRYGVRSLDRAHPERSARNYWRGPVWANITWLTALGLGAATARSARRARWSSACSRAVDGGGMREYFSPESGRGLGAQRLHLDRGAVPSRAAAADLDCRFTMAIEPRAMTDAERWFRERFQRTPERDALFTTLSGEPVSRSTRRTTSGSFDERIGFPGEFPFTRGVYPSMYRGRLWTMRQFAGFGTAEETNERFRYLLDHGQTGLSTAFDMPSLMGHDSDHPRSRGRGGPRGRGDRLARRHGDAVRRDRHGRGVHVDDDQRAGRRDARVLRRRGGAAGHAAGAARRHDPDGHPQGVHRPEGVVLPDRPGDAARDRHGRVLRAGGCRAGTRSRSPATTSARPARRRSRSWRSRSRTASPTSSRRSSAASTWTSSRRG